MSESKRASRVWLGIVAMPALLLALGVATSSAVAHGASGTPSGRPVGPTPTPTFHVDAFLFLQPSNTTGNCLAPSNGGATGVGCRFVFDLMLNAGSNHADNGVTSQQSYLTFTNQYIVNASVAQIGASCNTTSTVTADTAEFDLVLQNEVCNSNTPCDFFGTPVPPASIAYASGSIANCHLGCPYPDHPDNPF